MNTRQIGTWWMSMRWYISFPVIAFTLTTTQLVAQAVPQGVILSPQPDNYRGYWPGSCVEAVSRTTAFHQRTGPDTTYYALAADTMLFAVKVIAQQCAANFSETSVIPRDLVLFAQVLLAAGDDNGARRAVERRLAADAMAQAAQRAATLRDVVVAYASARPARLANARQYLAVLDTISGEDAARERLTAHSAMAWAILRTGDTVALRTEAEAMITAGQQMSADDRAELGGRILTAYEYLRDIAGMQTGTAAAPSAVIARARADLGKVPGLQYAIDAYAAIAALYGTPAPRIHARYWTTSLLGDTIRPALGKPSLIVFNATRANVPGLRRLAALGIDITVIRSTRGHFAGRGPLDADTEAKALQEYYRNKLGIPGALALTVTEYDRIPDGRRVRKATKNELAYRVQSGVWGVLVDQQGVIRRVYNYWMPWTELRIEEALRTL